MKVVFACLCAVLLSGNVFAQSSAQPVERRAPRAEAFKGPQHLAIVIDCSSQSKRTFERSLRQATRAIERLTEKDTVSIVVFDDAAELLLPATSAADKALILEKLKELKPKGKRALFAGIAKGAEEVRRNKSAEQAKRVLLLSGNGSAAPIGPSSPEDVRTLTESLAKEKITLFVPQDGNERGGHRGKRPRRQGGKKEKGGGGKRVE